MWLRSYVHFVEIEKMGLKKMLKFIVTLALLTLNVIANKASNNIENTFIDKKDKTASI